MASMRRVVVNEAGKGFALDEGAVPEPGRGELRIAVKACGICHSDHFVADGLWPGLALPRVPGHEVAGIVDAVGEGVSGFAPGDRVGLGWHGGHDGSCHACLSGHFLQCENARITGIHMDGGYADHVLAPAVAVARLPEGMDFRRAAPLLCAGVTTFNALRNVGAPPGSLVAVQGLGGLGHLGVQYARAMGFEVAAVSREPEKRAFAEALGAHHYVDAKAESAPEALRRLGGARVVLATAPNAAAISELVGGLGVAGCLLVVAAPFEPLQIPAPALIPINGRVQFWASGSAADSQDALAFAQQHGIEPRVETFPLAEVRTAYGRMMDGSVRFRSVLDLEAG